MGPSDLTTSPPSDSIRTPETTNGIVLSDVIGNTRDIAIFSGLTRDVNPVSDRLDNSAQNATVLAPTDEIMKSLPRKPWQDPEEYERYGETAYSGTAGEDRAQRNMRRFVEAHIVPKSPWSDNEKVQTLAGNTIWYEVRNKVKWLQPDNVQIISVADKVSNGEVWVIDGVIDFARKQ